MIRIIFLGLSVLLLALSTAVEERQLQAAMPGEAGTIALRVTLDEDNPAVMQNYTALPPEPEPSAVPEPATLGLLGLGVVGLLAAGLSRKRR